MSLNPSPGMRYVFRNCTSMHTCTTPTIGVHPRRAAGPPAVAPPAALRLWALTARAKLPPACEPCTALCGPTRWAHPEKSPRPLLIRSATLHRLLGKRRRLDKQAPPAHARRRGRVNRPPPAHQQPLPHRPRRVAARSPPPPPRLGGPRHGPRVGRRGPPPAYSRCGPAGGLGQRHLRGGQERDRAAPNLAADLVADSATLRA